MYFPSNFPVCGVGLVRNSVDELFVEGTCNVFGVDVCVLSLKVMELLSCCGGRLWASPCIVFQLVLVFLLWSHGLSMCSLQISVLFVLMRVEISLFSSGMLGCCGVFLLVQFLCVILLRMSCGRSLSVLPILPTGMYFFPAW